MADWTKAFPHEEWKQKHHKDKAMIPVVASHQTLTLASVVVHRSEEKKFQKMY